MPDRELRFRWQANFPAPSAASPLTNHTPSCLTFSCEADEPFFFLSQTLDPRATMTGLSCQLELPSCEKSRMRPNSNSTLLMTRQPSISSTRLSADHATADILAAKIDTTLMQTDKI
ncbi:hypothetical protein ACN47E_008609 [Coniothyrium glycines]